MYTKESIIKEAESILISFKNEAELFFDIPFAEAISALVAQDIGIYIASLKNRPLFMAILATAIAADRLKKTEAISDIPDVFKKAFE